MTNKIKSAYIFIITIIIILLLLILNPCIFCQTLFSNEKVICDSLRNKNSIYVIDLDGDKDLDIVSGSYSRDNPLGWHENMDGKGNFEKRKIIITNTKLALSVYSSDLDGDNDFDIILSSFSNNSITWYKNNGNGDFETEYIVAKSDSIFHPSSVYSADIDKDNDYDIITTSNDGRIVWFENIDGNGAFGGLKEITNEVSQPTSVYSIDIDGDSDFDVISSSSSDNKIAWYENNDGNGNFSAQKVISNSAIRAMSVYAADLDGDNDIDVLSASSGDNKIAWYENQDGKGTFGKQIVVSNTAYEAWAVYASDIDADNDMDILSASFKDNKIAWYENIDGNGTFSSPKIVTNSLDGAHRVCTADLDGDGDLDIIAGSILKNKIVWFENLSQTSVNNKDNTTIKDFKLNQNYPNPFNPSTTIKYQLKRSSKVILKIYNLDGQEIDILVNSIQKKGEHKVVWQPQGLASGVYFFKLQAFDLSVSSEQGFSITKKLILQK